MKKLLVVLVHGYSPFGQPGERIVRGDDMEAAGSRLLTNSEATSPPVYRVPINWLEECGESISTPRTANMLPDRPE